MSLSLMLQELGKYGQPHLIKMESGKWWSYINVFVPMDGMKVRVDSESNHSTPDSAVQECAARLIEMVNSHRNSPAPTSLANILEMK